MDVKKEKPKTKKQDDAVFMMDLEDRLRQESKLCALDDGPLVKAAENWLVARGFDPYKSKKAIHLSLVFNFLDSGKCELRLNVS